MTTYGSLTAETFFPGPKVCYFGATRAQTEGFFQLFWLILINSNFSQRWQYLAIASNGISDGVIAEQ